MRSEKQKLYSPLFDKSQQVRIAQLKKAGAIEQMLLDCAFHAKQGTTTDYEFKLGNLKLECNENSSKISIKDRTGRYNVILDGDRISGLHEGVLQFARRHKLGIDLSGRIAIIDFSKITRQAIIWNPKIRRSKRDEIFEPIITELNTTIRNTIFLNTKPCNEITYEDVQRQISKAIETADNKIQQNLKILRSEVYQVDLPIDETHPNKNFEGECKFDLSNYDVLPFPESQNIANATTIHVAPMKLQITNEERIQDLAKFLLVNNMLLENFRQKFNDWESLAIFISENPNSFLNLLSNIEPQNITKCLNSEGKFLQNKNGINTKELFQKYAVGNHNYNDAAKNRELQLQAFKEALPMLKEIAKPRTSLNVNNFNNNNETRALNISNVSSNSASNNSNISTHKESPKITDKQRIKDLAEFLFINKNMLSQSFKGHNFQDLKSVKDFITHFPGATLEFVNSLPLAKIEGCIGNDRHFLYQKDQINDMIGLFEKYAETNHNYDNALENQKLQAKVFKEAIPILEKMVEPKMIVFGGNGNNR